MDMPAFDTACFQDTRNEGGFSLVQAKSLTKAFVDATGHLPSVDALATFKAEVRQSLAELRTELKGEIAVLKADVFKALNEQARGTPTLVFGAGLLNAAVVGGVGLALSNALKGLAADIPALSERDAP